MALSKLVLLPGMDGTGDLFQPFLSMLPPSVSPSIVSYPRDRVLPYGDLHNYLEASVPRGEEYVLLAESFSGPLALEHAARNPAELRGLVLCASFASSPVPRAIRWLRPLVPLAALLHPPPRWILRRFLLDRQTPGQIVAAVRHAISSLSRRVLIARLREVVTIDLTPILPTVAVPVLYLVARRDRVVGPRGLEQLGPGIASLHSSVIDGPHLLLQARPEEAASEVVRFLKAVGGA